jgi:hypothetical protein
MDDDAQTILVGELVQDMPRPHVPSRRVRCHLCGSQVWVSKLAPSVQHVWCLQCALDDWAHCVGIGVAKETQAEVEAYGKAADVMTNSLREFIAKRDALFNNLTLEAATAHWNEAGFPPPVHPLVPLAAMHKARLQWLGATDAMLAESKQWLQDNDFGATMRGGAPLDPMTRDHQRMRLGKPPLGIGR